MRESLTIETRQLVALAEKSLDINTELLALVKVRRATRKVADLDRAAPLGAEFYSHLGVPAAGAWSGAEAAGASAYRHAAIRRRWAAPRSPRF